MGAQDDSMNEKEFLDDEFVSDSDDTEAVQVSTASPRHVTNVSARRRLEEYRDQKEMERLLEDDFSYF